MVKQVYLFRIEKYIDQHTDKLFATTPTPEEFSVYRKSILQINKAPAEPPKYSIRV